MTYVLMDENGEVLPVYSISSGLDYPGVGPEHAYLKNSKRAEYVSITDQEGNRWISFYNKARGDYSGVKISSCNSLCDETCTYIG